MANNDKDKDKDKDKDDYKAADNAIHNRMRRSDVQRRPRARSTNTPPARRIASAPAQVLGGYQHPHQHLSYASPARQRRQRRRQTTLMMGQQHHLLHSPHRGASAIYAATHPVDGEDTNYNMTRLLSGTRMRSRQLVVDMNSYTQRPPSSSSESLFGDDEDVTSPSDNNEEEEEEAEYHEIGMALDTATPDTEAGKGGIPGSSNETTPLIGSPPKLDHHHHHSPRHSTKAREGWLSVLVQQTSSVAVVALLNIMVSIPFGASYFPIGWKATDESSAGTDDGAGAEVVGDADDDVNGSFPLQGRQALGIRMFLFATIMGQLAFTFASKFENPVGLQMVENVPFLHALCHTVIRNQGYGKEALSTVFFLFAFSSVVVGITFYLLGKWKLGRIVYFFPNHVLVGCIGGIGVFIVVTAIEVTSDVTLTFDMDGLRCLVDHFHLLSVVLGFEMVLRFLQYLTQDKHGNSKYPLLSPVYYCLITPLFYLGLTVFGVGIDQASEQGYFFPKVVSEDGDAAISSSSSNNSSIWQDPHMWDIFQIINFSTISWTAVFQSTGTMIALAAFSLIHVRSSTKRAPVE
jgi:hypothetical protein